MLAPLAFFLWLSSPECCCRCMLWSSLVLLWFCTSREHTPRLELGTERDERKSIASRAFSTLDVENRKVSIISPTLRSLNACVRSLRNVINC